MIDSWSHGEERRERGRVDRGVPQSRRSRSPPLRRSEANRESKTRERDRSPAPSRSFPSHDSRPRERSQERERKRLSSRSPGRHREEDRSQREARERNKGRELLDSRSSDRRKRSIDQRSPSSSKRRKSRSLSPARSHHKKSRRDLSRSRSRSRGREPGSSRSERRRRSISPLPVRKRSSERVGSDHRSQGKSKSRRDSGSRDTRDHRGSRDHRSYERRGRSPDSKVGKATRDDNRSRRDSSIGTHSNRKRSRSPHSSHKHRDRSPIDRTRDAKGRVRDRSSHLHSRRSPGIDRYETSRSRLDSPGRIRRGKSPIDRSPTRNSSDKHSRIDSQNPKSARGSLVATTSLDAKGSREVREASHPERPEARDNGSRFSVAEVRSSKVSRDQKQSSGNLSRRGSPQATTTGANSVEVGDSRRSSSTSAVNNGELKTENMAGRGFYGDQYGYNQNQQMQAAFPLKPQYGQPGPHDPRQFSQSPQHMTPGSYHASPQAQSPYSNGRGNGWGSQAQQYSPPPQYPQQNFTAPNGSQGFYNTHSQSPPYQTMPSAINNSYQQQSFRGNQRAYRGNQIGNRGGRGEHRGGRGGHFQNLQWTSGSSQPPADRGQQVGSGDVTPQYTSPPQPYPSGSHPSSQQGHLSQAQIQPQEDEDSEDLFRPSKDLQIEDKESTKQKDDDRMPPPDRPAPVGPQSQQNSSKFSFAFKLSSKAAPTVPKPEISQKLNAAPVRKEPQPSPEKARVASSSRSIPTEPASSRRPDTREVAVPTTRKVKKIMKRLKKRPKLEEDFQKSDSVYYRKPGNESVVGSGTYGKVFKAVHVYTKNLVALKKIRMEGERDGFPVTAVREIKLLQSLKHLNIVNLQEVMVEKNDCFMVFEYLSHDLTGLLNHPTFKLEPAHKKHLAKQLFEGLDYLHRRGVLHRDIKAANILVSSDGLLKLADFGLARFYAKRRQLDYTNRVITIWYRSPELLLGETQYGPAVDIWSAACVLVEIFTRHAIFPGDGGEINQLEKIYAILGTPNRHEWPGLVDMAWFELLRPSARRPNVFAEKYKERVTPAAFELLEAMFLYDPAKRPSAADVLEHPYFTAEEPKPRQAIELSAIEGEWHEFESKALRKENERKDKEARRQAQKDAVIKADKEKKRGLEGEVAERETKRLHVEAYEIQTGK